MLILKAEQVQFCEVTRDAEAEVLPAVDYLGQLFVRGESFPLSERRNAIARIRDMLDNKGRVPVLVEDLAGLTLWYFDSHVTRIRSKIRKPIEADMPAEDARLCRGQAYAAPEGAPSATTPEQAATAPICRFRGRTY